QFLDVVFTKPLYRAEHMFAIGAVAHSETCSSWGFSTRLQKNRLFEPKCGHPLQRQGLSWRRVGRWNQLSKSALCIELTPQLERDKRSVSGKTVFSQRVRPEELIAFRYQIIGMAFGLNIVLVDAHILRDGESSAFKQGQRCVGHAATVANRRPAVKEAHEQ